MNAALLLLILAAPSAFTPTATAVDSTARSAATAAQADADSAQVDADTAVIAAAAAQVDADAALAAATDAASAWTIEWDANVTQQLAATFNAQFSANPGGEGTSHSIATDAAGVEYQSSAGGNGNRAYIAFQTTTTADINETTAWEVELDQLVPNVATSGVVKYNAEAGKRLHVAHDAIDRFLANLDTTAYFFPRVGNVPFGVRRIYTVRKWPGTAGWVELFIDGAYVGRVAWSTLTARDAGITSPQFRFGKSETAGNGAMAIYRIAIRVGGWNPRPPWVRHVQAYYP